MYERLAHAFIMLSRIGYQINGATTELDILMESPVTKA